jgi:hypothetical protein
VREARSTCAALFLTASASIFDRLGLERIAMMANPAAIRKLNPVTQSIAGETHFHCGSSREGAYRYMTARPTLTKQWPFQNEQKPFARFPEREKLQRRREHRDKRNDDDAGKREPEGKADSHTV